MAVRSVLPSQTFGRIEEVVKMERSVAHRLIGRLLGVVPFVPTAYLARPASQQIVPKVTRIIQRIHCRIGHVVIPANAIPLGALPVHVPEHPLRRRVQRGIAYPIDALSHHHVRVRPEPFLHYAVGSRLEHCRGSPELGHLAVLPGVEHPNVADLRSAEKVSSEGFVGVGDHGDVVRTHPGPFPHAVEDGALHVLPHQRIARILLLNRAIVIKFNGNICVRSEHLPQPFQVVRSVDESKSTREV
mmetsp:Transcript_31089/g.57442  ORF Transcript_31089/g.57442 Transcript_31089/m.57442 type:complete len:244 (+) Transcript_31089:332-1063(+)